jgi:type IV pilus assembly protein PilW
MVAGVENMQVLYGEDTDDDGVANRYRTADSVANFDDVVSMRIGLLLRTDGNISPDTNTQTYILNGTTAEIGTTVDPFNDRRGRYVFSSTIKLRNRGV